MKNKFFNNLVKKNYNDELEEILSYKNFSEDVKNILLSMIYKVETGYEDYVTIKRKTYDKETYIHKIIDVIDKDCKEISLCDINSSQNEKIDYRKGKIISKPIEKNILYGLAKIQNRKSVVKFIDSNISEAFSFILNYGNNINFVEPLRDFNGFSWNIMKNEIDDIYCNLLYQNLIFLTGNDFLDRWLNDYNNLIDYFELFKNNIKDEFGEEIKNSITTNLIKVSLLIKSFYDEDFKNKVLKEKQKLGIIKFKFVNTVDYLSQISNEKKKIEEEILKLDKQINNKENLKKGFIKYNENIKSSETIFNINYYKQKLIEDRKKLLENISNLNKQMMPKLFFNDKEYFNDRTNFYDLNLYRDNEKNRKEILKLIIKIQKIIIKCMYIRAKKSKDKEKLIDLLYYKRYYMFLPLNKEEDIYDNYEIKELLDKLSNYLINKLIKMGVLYQISSNNEIACKIINTILITKIIKIEDIRFKITKNRGIATLIVMDEKTEENKINLEDSIVQYFKVNNYRTIKLFK